MPVASTTAWRPTPPCERIVLVNLLTLRVLDGDDKPFKNGRYRLEIFTEAPGNDPDKKTQPLEASESRTNDEGILQQLVPANATFARLTLFPAVPADAANGNANATSSGSSDSSAPSASIGLSASTDTGAKTEANGTSSAGQTASQPLWTLDLNIRAPVEPDTIAGAQARLNNLNLYASEKVDEEQTGNVPAPNTIPIEPDENLGEDARRVSRLRRAIQRFQRLYKPHGDNEDATGELDAATKQKLVEKHGN